MRDDPGKRVVRVASQDILHGHPAVEGNIVGFASKSGQIDRFVRPTDEEAFTILEGEEFVLFVGGTHELKIATDWAPEGTVADDLLYIDPADNSVQRLPLGAAGKNEVQKVKVDGTGATHRLEFDGELTDKLAPGLTAAELKAELEELSNIQPGDVAVAGGPGDAGGTTPYIITFQGQYAGTNVPVLISVEEELTGGGAAVTITTDVAGVAAAVIPLGVVEEVDTARTPDVALVNTNALNAFIGA